MKVGLSCHGEVKLVMLRWLRVAGYRDDCKSIFVFGHFPRCRLTLKLPGYFWNALGRRSQRLGNEIARLSGTWEFKGYTVSIHTSVNDDYVRRPIIIFYVRWWWMYVARWWKCISADNDYMYVLQLIRWLNISFFLDLQWEIFQNMASIAFA